MAEYHLVHDQLEEFSHDKQVKLYDDFFSIMAAQQKKAFDVAMKEGDLLGAIKNWDYTHEDWYVKGFEDYEAQQALIDIPLTEAEDGYKIELPEAVWPIISTSQLFVYQEVGNGTMRYLGYDDLGMIDEDGHPLVAMNGTWVHIGGQLVCYESEGVRETKDGFVFMGSVKAKLNNRALVRLHIEWDPVQAESDGPTKGHVVNYTFIEADQLLDLIPDSLDLDDDTLDAFSSRMRTNLKPGDRLQFLFDYYDEQGNLDGISTYGKTVTVVKPQNLSVTDEPLESGDIVFGGLLTFFFNDTATTEKIEVHID